MEEKSVLTPEEERVIVHKGTEAPFSGEYCDHFEKGTYLCRRCGAPLYHSDAKFESGCGWPAFDDEIPGTVSRQTDADGVRTEIACGCCGAHLGHVFSGENLTGKNTRHCVNSVSLKFVPDSTREKAIFAAGCFWGVEENFRKASGVTDTRAGYTGGNVKKPSYEQVCSGNTGHYEAVEVTFDNSATDYETLLKLFFQIHDFTQADGQGPDIGLQYRSAVFYMDEEQKRTAEKVIERLEKDGHRVATRVLPAAEFWPAEDYHQGYYKK